ncbi:MAG: class I SAM-dependent methyltransferase [Candidatus Fermentithermobacillus carboniphilus]|uniref:Class I SAM-dependent methyltransferase n=1 Tax=Candidatus Fermentithermobacillus carboniphilus TaxID=3085328 RepID=A0AAT9LGH4_9FIRM|nr:MAG: class I SAM-dependent methyltransferase [Candidatus Fermentithermobacillus carboniphilus]
MESLSGVDRFFRSMVLMERGDYAGAREAASDLGGIYTPEYEACQRSQIEHVLNLVSAASGLIVDLASGVGTLVERLACCFPDRQVVVTDFSPRVLRRNKKYFHYLGIDKNLDFLAFDVRRMPFRDDCVPVFTSHVGLQNIRYPRRAVAEISRTLKGYMFATSIFYPKGDLETDQLLRENGLADLCYMDSALKVFTESGLRVSVENLMEVRAQPTPRSELLGGAGFDALPVKEMAISWCTLVARH